MERDYRYQFLNTTEVLSSSVRGRFRVADRPGIVDSREESYSIYLPTDLRPEQCIEFAHRLSRQEIELLEGEEFAQIKPVSYEEDWDVGGLRATNDDYDLVATRGIDEFPSYDNISVLNVSEENDDIERIALDILGRDDIETINSLREMREFGCEEYR